MSLSSSWWKSGARASVAGLLLAGVVGVTGCETEQRRVGPITPTSDVSASLPKERREEKLREKTEKDPQDPAGWFNYAAYWEECQDWPKAIACYERGNELLDQKQWTGGNYHLARAYCQVQDYVQAMRHLDKVIALESPDPKVACLNNDFPEAHFLKGGILYVNKNWRKARAEFERFLELGGEPNRVEEFLDRIERETR